MPLGGPVVDSAGSTPIMAEYWKPGDAAPPGYRLRYTVSPTWVIGGASTLALSHTVTTLIAGAIANTGGVGMLIAPLGGIPVIGSFPLAGFAAAIGAGPGTVATLVALGVTQTIGFGIMIRGIVKRRPAGITPDCEQASLRISPLVSPQTAGVALGGSL